MSVILLRRDVFQTIILQSGETYSTIHRPVQKILLQVGGFETMAMYTAYRPFELFAKKQFKALLHVFILFVAWLQTALDFQRARQMQHEEG